MFQTVNSQYIQQCSVEQLISLLNDGNDRTFELVAQTAVSEANEFKNHFKTAQTEEQKKSREAHEPKAEFQLELASDYLVPTDLGKEMSLWVQQNQETVQALMTAAQITIQALGRNCLPGHDARHIIVKDGASALALIAEQELQDFQKLFLIPSLLHDAGKFVELKSSLVGEKHHADVGFLITKKILDTFEIPAVLRDHLLDAVLSHSTGDSRTSFIAQAVQRADREQLVGAEMVYRTFVHGVGLKSRSLEEAFGRMVSVYSRNLYPQIGEQGEQRASERKAVGAAFLWALLPDEKREEFFAPELNQSGKALSPEVMDFFQKELEFQKQLGEPEAREVKEVLELLKPFLNPPQAAPVVGEIEQAISHEIANQDSEQLGRLYHAVEYAIERQREYDQMDDQLLQGLVATSDPKSIEYKFADWILRFKKSD